MQILLEITPYFREKNRTQTFLQGVSICGFGYRIKHDDKQSKHTE